MILDEFELIVDNFAGGGGASKGIEMGLGRFVDIAVNHDPIAIAMHTVNHPHTRHFCESVWDVDPKKACGDRPVGLAWFSPDCTHFSKAKGGKPVKKHIRGLAWVVLKWARSVRPRVIMLENVEEFVTWGPLVKAKNGDLYPCPDRKGKTFRAFLAALRKEGYAVEHKPLRASDYGAPTIRKRLFLIARCDGHPIAWPEPTHGDPKTEAVTSGRLLPWRTAAECIDWSIPAPSIFERKRPLAEATCRRIAKGIMRYVVNAAEPFIVTYYGDKGGEFRGQGLGDPLATQTTENRHGLVVPLVAPGPLKYPLPSWERTEGEGAASKADKVTAFMAKHYGGATGCPIDTPTPTQTARGTQNQIVAASLVRHMGQSIGSDLSDPARTALQGTKDSLVTSHLLKLRGTCKDGQSIDQPMPTVTAGGTHIGEVRAFLMKYYGNDKDGIDICAPMHTVTTKDRFGLVTVNGEEYKIMDIGMRMLTPRELFRAQGFPDSYIIDRGPDGTPITKTNQVAKCGNSVCPDLAAALAKANIGQRIEVAA